jgi:ABC-2 type transport system permease protein
VNAFLTYVQNVGLAIRTSFGDRTNFTLQALGMVVNDGFFLAIWFLFFAGFKSVGGWRLADTALLIGMMMTLFAVAGIFFGGYRDMAATILKGELDALLTQPKTVLLRLLARESLPSAWGDLIVGIFLIVWFGRVAPHEVPTVILCLVVGFLVYVSSAVAYASLAFWFSGARSFARDLTDFLVLFSSYPGSIYTGATRVVAYTLLPAGFVVLAPIEFLRAPGASTFAFMIAGALVYSAIALTLFHLGLSRYRRGDVQAGLS